MEKIDALMLENKRLRQLNSKLKKQQQILSSLLQQEKFDEAIKFIQKEK